MLGKIAVALAVVASITTLAVASEPATAPQPETAATKVRSKPSCPKGYRERVRATYAYSRAGGYFATRPVRKRAQKRLVQQRRCVRYKLDNRKKYRRMLRYARYRRAEYRAHHYFNIITVYGKWAVEPHIVSRESGGNPCARNPSSTAGGYYQFIDSTWYAMMRRLPAKARRMLRRLGWRGQTNYGGRHPAACAPPALQHAAGYVAWNGGNNNHWALTR